MTERRLFSPFGWALFAIIVALGFFMGVGPARYCQHVKSSHLFWALPAYAGMIGLIVLFNLAVGHYREMLIANPDARSFQVMPRMMETPFAIYDIKSVALVIIACGLYVIFREMVRYGKVRVRTNAFDIPPAQPTVKDQLEPLE